MKLHSPFLKCMKHCAELMIAVRLLDFANVLMFSVHLCCYMYEYSIN